MNELSPRKTIKSEAIRMSNGSKSSFRCFYSKVRKLFTSKNCIEYYLYISANLSNPWNKLIFISSFIDFIRNNYPEMNTSDIEDDLRLIRIRVSLVDKLSNIKRKKINKGNFIKYNAKDAFSKSRISEIYGNKFGSSKPIYNQPRY
ncbi:MAG: hypothetical protein Q8L07_14700 [Sediminibacterium sp.]|nr:hypothetical protein [Sediminibacterium sp.]